jgi:hypothetical protein
MNIVKLKIFCLAILVGTAVTAQPAAARAAMTFKSVKVQLPDSDVQFPAGPHADAINNNCLSCHSADMVLNQPPMARAKWQAEVDKMRTSYKAPVNDADAKTIVDYLTWLKSPK